MKKFKINIQQFAEPEETKTYTQEEVDKMIDKRFARMKADFEKEKKELEKIQKDLDAKNAELSKIKTDEIKRTTLAKYKMPDKFLDRISGANEEEIEASVKGFAETMGEYVKSLGASGVPGAMNGGSNGGADKKAQLEDLRKKAFESGSDIDRANYVRAKQELENSGGNE
jgi:putative prophage lambdaCh01, scaffold protein